MIKSQRTKILNAIKKLNSWQWYNIQPKAFSREDMIEVLKWCIDDGMPYAIRGDWDAFRLESFGGPMWQQREYLPDGVTLEFITAETDTSFTDVKGRLHQCTGPPHVKVWRDGKLIGIEPNLKARQ